jgi:hypothetical protein
VSERISDLNLELGSQRHRVHPATLTESRHSQSSRFVNGLRGSIDGVADPDGPVKMRVHAPTATGAERSTFAIFSPRVRGVISVDGSSSRTDLSFGEQLRQRAARRSERNALIRIFDGES